MMELFLQADAGLFSLDQAVPVVNEFKSIVDGSPYTLSTADDSEADLYKAVGQTRTCRELCELMITVSSNLATNNLIEKLGVTRIRATTAALGAEGMSVRRRRRWARHAGPSEEGPGERPTRVARGGWAFAVTKRLRRVSGRPGRS